MSCLDQSYFHILQTIQNLVDILEGLQEWNGDVLRANASKLAMNICNKSSVTPAHLNFLWGITEADVGHYFCVIFSCSLQYCALLWHNCQHICPATGRRRKLFFYDRKHSFSCWSSELGCIISDTWTLQQVKIHYQILLLLHQTVLRITTFFALRE